MDNNPNIDSDININSNGDSPHRISPNNNSNNIDLTTSRSSQSTLRRFRRLISLVTVSHLLLLFSIPTNVNGNNLPLLSGILRTFQVSACDGEQLSMECDSRTVISVVVVQYGQPVPQKFLCRNFFLNQQRNSSHLGAKSTLSAESPKNAENSSLSTANDSRICPAANHLRYLFLQKVESTCREQNRCQLELTASNLGIETDPCPHQTKFAEVAFKCRPNIFLNKVTCEGGRLKLFCNEEDRIVIFSAFFGSTTEPVPECPRDDSSVMAARSRFSNSAATNQSTSNGNCQVSYATESVMSFCHGRRTCSISADTNTFGVPVCPVRLGYHLKVVYNCVSKRLLKNGIEFVDKDVSSTTASTTTTSTTTTTSPTQIRTTSNSSSLDPINEAMDHNENFIEDDFDARKPLKKNSNFKDSSMEKYPLDHRQGNHPLLMDSSITGNSRRPNNHQETQLHRQQHNQHINCSVLPPSMQVIGFVSDWISAIEYIKKNRERFILYLLVSLFASLVCFLAVLSVKLYHQKSATLRKVREQQVPVNPFEILDFDDEDLDDYDENEPAQSSPHYRLETVDSDPFCGSYGTRHHPHRHHHHQNQHFVPQDTPSASILAEPRPLLYSTLRKKASIKASSTNWGHPAGGSSRLSASPGHSTTLPKGILVTSNRNSSSYYGSSIPASANPKRMSISNSISSANQSLNSDSMYSYGSTGTVRHKKDSASQNLIRHSTSIKVDPVQIQVIDQQPGHNNNQAQDSSSVAASAGGATAGNDDQNTQPKSLSQNIDNYFM